MSWLIFLNCILIMGKLSGADEETEELDTGQPNLNYKKVHKIVNQTNREIVTRTIIKPVSYSYITADVNPSAPASANKLTAVHVQREDSTIAEERPEEDIQIIQESQIRPSHQHQSQHQLQHQHPSQHQHQQPSQHQHQHPSQHQHQHQHQHPSQHQHQYQYQQQQHPSQYQHQQQVPASNPAPVSKQEKQLVKPVLIRHRVQKKIIETNRPQKIIQLLQPVLVKKQVTYGKPKVQIVPNKVIAVKRPEEVRPYPPRPPPKKAKNPPPLKASRPVNNNNNNNYNNDNNNNDNNNDIIATNENRPRQVAVNKKSVKFPLNTVLPGNSIHFDDEQYENLAPAVNAFSDLNPSRSPKEGLVVSHNAVTSPHSSRTRTTITNHGHRDPSADYPLREYTATTHNNRGKNGDEFEHTEQFRVRGGNGDLSESASAGLRSEQQKHGGGGGGKHHESSGGSDHHSDHHSDKGGKGEKGYKKKHKHNKSDKGHHDKENHSGEYEEKGGHEKKKHDSDDYYKEHHEGEKGEKGKKFGEGGKHKKGHSTHGEHKIVKKDEYVKSTKFYDEDHDDGEHEEHGKYYGHHEEKKGGHKKGGHHSSEHDKQEKAKKGHHDKGHEEEQHSGHDEAQGHDDHYEHEEEYGSKKGGESAKKWGKSSGKN